MKRSPTIEDAMVKAADDYAAIKAGLERIEKEKRERLNTPEEPPPATPEPTKPDPWGYGGMHDYFG